MSGVEGVGLILGTCMQTDRSFVVTTHYKAKVEQACPGGKAADPNEILQLPVVNIHIWH